MGEWEQTRLWQHLKDKDDEASRDAGDTLSRCMPNIVLVLGAAATSPADFTLHDDQHSFRVAERMVDICPAGTLAALSGYEIALLLLSAYLHDIGMTPDRGLVLGHYSYLFAGDADGLTQEDERSFRGWLDENGRGALPPLAETMKPSAALSASLQLVTHYCRHRHVEWSDRWMASNLDGLAMGHYAAWLDDLRRLCASHHEGLPSLTTGAFAPRLVAAGAVVNLRYLACLLRVADVVEFDPERTPDIVFRQRAVAPGSAIYWHKDHEIALELSPTKVSLTARPPTAVLHRAIDLTIAQIDSELRLCRDLADRGSFSQCPGVGPLPHEWSLAARCFPDIAPRNNVYEYIDGAFRPDVDRILQLLAGVGLYGSPLAALREVIQNASDAVHEQMAWQRLGWEDPSDSGRLEALQRLSAIEISVRHEEDGCWLDCTDSGVGMTKAIITDHLLVSGSTRKREIAELDRLCRRAGFSLDRTGRFGIGVLSYFMIGEEMILTTERSGESGTADGSSWRFSSNGLDDFGELCRLASTGHGTTVSLRLRDDMLVGIDAWEAALEEYLDDTLVHLPCVLKLRLASATKSYGPGWCRPDSTLSSRLSWISRSRGASYDSEIPAHYSESQRREYEHEIASHEDLKAEIRGAIKFEQIGGSLPGELGLFRAKIAYFELEGGKCLGYLRAECDGDRAKVRALEGGDIYQPPGVTITSWNGMKLDTRRYEMVDEPGVWLEVDLRGEAAGQLAVSRSVLKLSKIGHAALQDAMGTVLERRRALAGSWKDSIYYSLNGQLAELPQMDTKGSNWIASSRGERVWRPVTLPAMSSDCFPYQPDFRYACLGDQAVTVIPALRRLGAEAYMFNLQWHPRSAGPDRVVRHNQVHGGMATVWETIRDGEPRHPLGDTAEFPPEWEDIAVCGETNARVPTTWNGRHPLVVATTAVGLEWCDTSLPVSLDPLEAAEEMLKDRSRAASWLMRLLYTRSAELWQALDERSPGFREQVWRLLFFLKDEPVDQWPVVKAWAEGSVNHGLVEVGVDRWETHLANSFEKVAELLPEPAGHRWNLTLTRTEDAADASEESTDQLPF